MKSAGAFYLLAVLLSSVTLVHGAYVSKEAEDKDCKGNFSGLPESVKLKENKIGEIEVLKLSEACTCEISILFELEGQQPRTPAAIACSSQTGANNRRNWYWDYVEMVDITE